MKIIESFRKRLPQIPGLNFKKFKKKRTSDPPLESERVYNSFIPVIKQTSREDVNWQNRSKY